MRQPTVTVRRLIKLLPCSFAKLPVSNCLPEQGVVNITNISFENNQIKIGVNLQITLPLPSELSIQNLDLGEDAVKNGMAKDSTQ
ncbi:MAG TPA: hypothetical protein DCP31_24190 [Cyanobacteria bacterium UBA8543]|nr:hypothetical protein [Cyanobacteria bacterium UBA8543]